MSGKSRSELRERRVPEEIVERVLRRFLRGGTWQALAREIAWHALRTTNADHTRLDALTSVVEAKLAEMVDGLDSTVETVCVAATVDHLQAWPHDREGAETIAVLDGDEEGLRVLGRVYVDVLEWAVDVIGERQRRDGLSGHGWLRPPSSGAHRSKLELPALVVQQLKPRLARFGWPRRDAA
jgi:hypothetical protein